MSWGKVLCKLNVHDYIMAGESTKANDGRGGYIYKSRLVCSRCKEGKLTVAKRG